MSLLCPVFIIVCCLLFNPVSSQVLVSSICEESSAPPAEVSSSMNRNTLYGLCQSHTDAVSQSFFTVKKCNCCVLPMHSNSSLNSPQNCHAIKRFFFFINMFLEHVAPSKQCILIWQEFYSLFGLSELEPKALQNICSGSSHLDLTWWPVPYLLTFILAHWLYLLYPSYIHWQTCCYYLFLPAHIWRWIWGIREAAKHGRQQNMMDYPTQWVDSSHLPSPIPQLFTRCTPLPAYCTIETTSTV